MKKQRESKPGDEPESISEILKVWLWKFMQFLRSGFPRKRPARRVQNQK